MDIMRLAEVLRGTIDPKQREAAEKELETMRKIIGFGPLLLQVVMSNNIESPVRQAAAITLKNLVVQSWPDAAEPVAIKQGGEREFHVHEQDRAMLRDAFVDAVVTLPPLLRAQMAVCLINVIKHDFPVPWSTIVQKIELYLMQPTSETWLGALMALYQLVKHYEYKSVEVRGPLYDAMRSLLPKALTCLVTSLDLPDAQSDYQVSVQKQALKVFHSLISYHLPLDLVNPMFTNWMEACRKVIERPVPPAQMQPPATPDEDDMRPSSLHWKCKKWALHIITRITDRYGCVGSVAKEYREFAKNYTEHFSRGIVHVLLEHVLDPYRRGIYVSPRVLHLTLGYLASAVGQAQSWGFIKPHTSVLIEEIIFRLMCVSEEDLRVWQNDPKEYIRIKFDMFEEHVSPVTAAQQLLVAVCQKRKNVLQRVMTFINGLLNNPAQLQPSQCDGIFHMIGSLSSLLLKKKPYKLQLEAMLATYAFPLFERPEGFLRARACWLVQQFAETTFKQPEITLKRIMELLSTCVLNQQEEMPVRVQAAVALQEYITEEHEVTREVLAPIIRDLAIRQLELIRLTEIDDMTTVLQRLVTHFTDELAPSAYDIMNHLAVSYKTLMRATEEEGEDEDRSVTAMGLLGTMETILSVWEDQEPMLVAMEPVVCDVVNTIFAETYQDNYEEALSLLFALTSTRISEVSWKMYEVVYSAFERDAAEFFVDMMPFFHNLITVDTKSFLSNENHIVAMYTMAKKILTNFSDDHEVHAAKLLEVMILQCGTSIDKYIPTFIELAIERLTREEVKTSELRTILLQVIIASFYVNHDLTLSTLERLPPKPDGTSMTTFFIRQWVSDMDCFLGLHDRKLCILGICVLLDPSWQNKPPVLEEVLPKLLPNSVMIFEGLERAYAYRAQELCSDDEDEEEGEAEGEDEGEGEQPLSSDEDEIDDEGCQYLESLEKPKQNGDGSRLGEGGVEEGEEGEEDGDDDDDFDDEEETALECSYATPLDASITDPPKVGQTEPTVIVDEYSIFKALFQGLEQAAPALYNQMVHSLEPKQKKKLGEIFVLADQRRAQAESKRIEKSGGYVFQNTQVPVSFNFATASNPFSSPK